MERSLSLLKDPTKQKPPSINEKQPHKEAIKDNQEKKEKEKINHTKLTYKHDEMKAQVKNELATYFYPKSSIIIFRKHFHDNWYEILRAMQQEVSDFGSISSIQPDRAILVENKEHGQTLCKIKGWYKVGAYKVRFEPWNA